MKGKRTEWFDGHEKPSRKGVYEIDFMGEKVKFSKWNGRRWLFSGVSPDIANRIPIESGHQNLRWRGLAKEPKK